MHTMTAHCARPRTLVASALWTLRGKPLLSGPSVRAVPKPLLSSSEEEDDLSSEGGAPNWMGSSSVRLEVYARTQAAQARGARSQLGCTRVQQQQQRAHTCFAPPALTLHWPWFYLCVHTCQHKRMRTCTSMI